MLCLLESVDAVYNDDAVLLETSISGRSRLQGNCSRPPAPTVVSGAPRPSTPPVPISRPPASAHDVEDNDAPSETISSKTAHASRTAARRETSWIGAACSSLFAASAPCSAEGAAAEPCFCPNVALDVSARTPAGRVLLLEEETRACSCWWGGPRLGRFRGATGGEPAGESGAEYAAAASFVFTDTLKGLRKRKARDQEAPVGAEDFIFSAEVVAMFSTVAVDGRADS